MQLHYITGAEKGNVVTGCQRLCRAHLFCLFVLVDVGPVLESLQLPDPLPQLHVLLLQLINLQQVNLHE